MTNVLHRGQCYEKFMQDAYSSCKASIAQHCVQQSGIEAAIQNLRDTYGSIRRPYEALEVCIVIISDCPCTVH